MIKLPFSDVRKLTGTIFIISQIGARRHVFLKKDKKLHNAKDGYSLGNIRPIKRHKTDLVTVVEDAGGFFFAAGKVSDFHRFAGDGNADLLFKAELDGALQSGFVHLGICLYKEG